MIALQTEYNLDGTNSFDIGLARTKMIQRIKQAEIDMDLPIVITGKVARINAFILTIDELRLIKAHLPEFVLEELEIPEGV